MTLYRFILMLIVSSLLVSCGVSESDIATACAKLAATRNFQSYERVNIIHELDQKAGREDSSQALVDLTMSTITANAYIDGNWETACRRSLKKDYVGEDAPPKTASKNNMDWQRGQLDGQRKKIIANSSVTNLFCERKEPNDRSGSDFLWLAAQLYFQEDKRGTNRLNLMTTYRNSGPVPSYREKNTVTVVQDRPGFSEYENLKEDCELGSIPLCKLVGESLVLADVYTPTSNSRFIDEDDYWTWGSYGSLGSMYINRKTLEAGDTSSSMGREYQCKTIGSKEFEEKVIKPIEEAFQQTVERAEAKLLKEKPAENAPTEQATTRATLPYESSFCARLRANGKTSDLCPTTKTLR
jgi:hypothetical protein